MASCGYLAVLTTTAVHPTALSAPATIGLLIGLGTVAAMCTLAAVLACDRVRRAERTKDSSCSQVDDIDWAIQFGVEVAEAFPDREAGKAAPRGPSIR